MLNYTPLWLLEGITISILQYIIAAVVLQKTGRKDAEKKNNPTCCQSTARCFLRKWIISLFGCGFCVNCCISLGLARRRKDKYKQIQSAQDAEEGNANT